MVLVPRQFAQNVLIKNLHLDSNLRVCALGFALFLLVEAQSINLVKSLAQLVVLRLDFRNLSVVLVGIVLDRIWVFCSVNLCSALDAAWTLGKNSRVLKVPPLVINVNVAPLRAPSLLY